MEIMLMCSLLVCTDAVAAVSIVKYDEQPKLFSLIFGEGITNDAVCIILFNTVYEYAGPHSEFTSATPIKVVYGFVLLAFFSILIGLIFGVISAYVLKKFRFLTVNPVIEVNLVFVFGYLSYCVTELFHYSGIIALLVSGVVMAKYSWYNLSPQAKQVTSISFQVIAYAVEAFVFGYLGITFFSYIQLNWSWQLFISMLIICCLGRFIGTIGIIKCFEMFGYKSGIKFRDLIFISYAGIIRGAVAFGLVLRIDENVNHRSVIVTTSLALVCFTTIFFGSTVATVQKCLFGKKLKEEHEDNHDPNASHHEFVKHYNEDEGKEEDDATPVAIGADGKPVKNVPCIKILKNADKAIIKPLLIYNYESNTHKKQ
jgi:NhaP-type Na+/H+ or K+/H+ antiporter